MLIIIAISLLALGANGHDSFVTKIKNYECGACRSVLEYGQVPSIKFGALCRKHLSKTGCEFLFSAEVLESLSSEDFCLKHGLCASNPEVPVSYAALSTNSPNIRVSKAIGTKGYDKVRLSLITNSSISPSDFPFADAYIAPFKYRWTQFHLATAVVSVTPGVNTKFTVAGTPVNVFVPKEDEGTRGIVIADPCFQSTWISCKYQDSWAMLPHLTSLLNAASSHDDMHYYHILGDNFYDRDGAFTDEWFQALSLDTKSKVHLSVPGNHDTWVFGVPSMYQRKDQLQNGFMQWYGNDNMASLQSPLIPFDFSVDPDGPNVNAQSLPPASNMFTFSKLGNVMFIGYSGAHDWADQEKYFVQACNYAAESNPKAIFLEGHWSSDGDGCTDTSVPTVFDKVSALPACAAVKSKFKYLEGHTHCNQVMAPDTGFMLGAMGMSDHGCGGQFGIPVIDTFEGRMRVYYFTINDADKKQDFYQSTLDCFLAKGVSGCYDLPSVVKWADVAL